MHACEIDKFRNLDVDAKPKSETVDSDYSTRNDLNNNKIINNVCNFWQHEYLAYK